jgi:KDO2-lipid IV(A) lauroyltransferase
MIDWLACLVVRAISACCCLLPPEAAVWIGERFGELAMLLRPARTRIGQANLRAAFDGARAPGDAARDIRECYRQLGAGFVEMLRLPVIDRAYIDRYITIEGRGRFDSAMASGRPVILLTAHFGNWELGSITAALSGYPVVALARAQDKFPRLYRLLVSFRESKGCRIVHKGGAMKRLITALRGGQLIGIVGDQASRQGIWVDFFGRPALFATGPFDLAHSKGALILQAFIHRVRGPYHRVIIEQAFEVSRALPRAEALRQGAERFAATLERHIRRQPGHWLWMHKRWKHTPSRRALVLSDGKMGHVKQSLAVVSVLGERRPGLTHTVVDVRYRNRAARLAALCWAGAVGGKGAERCLSWTLTPESAGALLSRYADVIISCGSSLAPVNLLWSTENRAKSIVIMNPAPLPLSRFDLVIAPRHDQLPPRANLVPVAGALAKPSAEPDRASAHLRAHPRFRGASEPSASPHRHPVAAVLIGGDTADYALDAAFLEQVAQGVQTACGVADGWYLMTTSRRTAPAAERRLAQYVEGDARCRLLLLASRDRLDGTMDGLLASADVIVVTGESISMVSEACASGRRVVVVRPPRRRSRRGWPTAKHDRFLAGLAREGQIVLSAVSDLPHAIRHALADTAPPKRLDNLAAVRTAAEKLL